MSVFFIKLCLISVSAKQDVRHPAGGAAHLFAHGFQVNSWVAFDNQFVMDVSDDEAMAECLHGIAEDVATNCLNDILHEFRAVGFDAFPLLC